MQELTSDWYCRWGNMYLNIFISCGVHNLASVTKFDNVFLKSLSRAYHTSDFELGCKAAREQFFWEELALFSREMSMWVCPYFKKRNVSCAAYSLLGLVRRESLHTLGEQRIRWHFPLDLFHHMSSTWTQVQGRMMKLLEPRPHTGCHMLMKGARTQN